MKRNDVQIKTVLTASEQATLKFALQFTSESLRSAARIAQQVGDAPLVATLVGRQHQNDALLAYADSVIRVAVTTDLTQPHG